MQNSNPTRLFAACFIALLATSFIFVFRAMFIHEWGMEFNLSETQKGEILGAGLWPFAISIVLFSLFIDRIGYGTVLTFAFSMHIVSILLILFAKGYLLLYFGTFLMALANGAVEAAVNPMVITLFPNEKIRRLSFLHAAWPAGMVIGGLLALFLGGFLNWQMKFSIVFIPVLVYGVFLLKQRFPIQERVKAGVPFKEMLNELGILGVLIISYLIISQIGNVFGLTSFSILVIMICVLAFSMIWIHSIGKLLFVILMILMIPLATTELGTDSWIIDLMTHELKKIGLEGAWILIYTATLMTLMRLFASKYLKKISPLMVLTISCMITAFGLWGLSFTVGAFLLIAATFFGMAKALFWPTMLGVVSEQFPRGGALMINVIAGTGMIGAGIIGTVLLGFVQDKNFEKNLIKYDVDHSTQMHQKYLIVEKKSVAGYYKMLDAALMEHSSPMEKKQMDLVKQESKKSALKWVALLPALLTFAFFLLYIWFKLHGGYKSVSLTQT